MTTTEQQLEISYMRQEGWFNPLEHPNATVSLVGCGGIGSSAALALAKLGIPRLALIDPDVVERHNLPNQMFQPYAAAEGATKVDALAQSLRAMTPLDEIETYETELGAQPPAIYEGTVVVSGLDSMEARKELWDEKLKRNIRVPLLIDARLGGEIIRLFAIKPFDPAHIEYYEQTLYTDEEAVENVCTMQSIIDVSFIVSALITRAVRLHFDTEKNPEKEVFFDVANLAIMKEA